MTVVVALFGGLGNLLFQVAAGRELAARRGTELLVLPPATRREREQRPVLWDALGQRIPEAPPPVVGRLARAERRRSRGRRVAVIAQKGSQAHLPPDAVDPTAELVLLRGLFQHPGYFGSQPEAIGDALRTWTDGAVAGPPPDVVLHLRRGDYIPRGWELPVDYYVGAVRSLAAVGPPPASVRVVGDDRLAAEGLAARLAAVVPDWPVEVEPPRSLVGDFGVLATARHLVMSNSTFAWWAAVVGDTAPGRLPDRRVVVPADWIGTGGHVLIRPRWTPLGEDGVPGSRG